ncbi:hypothetical protein BKA83DRAFT_586457 [Pisolithus microcarpus]|nr:hypothetical protein BKA83DRAFT_586457 [Pisolithus microcarpus]
MADFIQGLDPGKLVLAGTVLSFIISPFSAPPYNLPIFLLGTFAQESNDAVQSLRVFTGCLAGSIVYDLIWMITNHQHVLSKLLTVLLFLLKVRRGTRFTLGTDLGGTTVWSMPGGFTSMGREGYQTVDDEPRSPPRVAPAARPSPITVSQPTLQPGAYQTA